MSMVMAVRWALAQLAQRRLLQAPRLLQMLPVSPVPQTLVLAPVQVPVLVPVLAPVAVVVVAVVVVAVMPVRVPRMRT